VQDALLADSLPPTKTVSLAGQRERFIAEQFHDGWGSGRSLIQGGERRRASRQRFATAPTMTVPLHRIRDVFQRYPSPNDLHQRRARIRAHGAKSMRGS
jgi:hypothetical protein